MSGLGLADVAVYTHRSIVSSLDTILRLSTARLVVGLMSTSNSRVQVARCCNYTHKLLVSYQHMYDSFDLEFYR